MEEWLNKCQKSRMQKFLEVSARTQGLLRANTRPGEYSTTIKKLAEDEREGKNNSNPYRRFSPI
jgi:hypothetical protein